MTSTDIFFLWSDQAAVAVITWLFVIVLLLYLARKPAHTTILTAGSMTRYAFRLASRSVYKTAKRLANRNREVLLAMGRENCERLIEREFHRVNAVVTRDLSAFPNLHRRINEQITNITEDYHNSAEIPPPPPGWVKAVDAVAKLRTDDSSMVGKILSDIHETVSRSERNALKEYSSSNTKRHLLLKKMVPSWRRLSRILESVNGNIATLEDRSRQIDRHMSDYEQILARSPKAERMLSSSSLTQFFIAGTVLAIAAIGGLINFYLIALPMSEMVGGGSMIGPLRTSNVAALVIIMIEIAMGLFLMESLRITRLFPVIGSMDDRMRSNMFWFTFAMLFILACVESSLAFMRDLLAADREALIQTLSGTEAGVPEFRWIPSIGQMVMGFVLPFALTFVAIPLESFIHSSRTVIGVAAVGALHVVEFILRQAGNIFYYLGMLLTQVYDLVIFVPLRLEEALQKNGENRRNVRGADHDDGAAKVSEQPVVNTIERPQS